MKSALGGRALLSPRLDSCRPVGDSCRPVESAPTLSPPRIILGGMGSFIALSANSLFGTENRVARPPPLEYGRPVHGVEGGKVEDGWKVDKGKVDEGTGRERWLGAGARRPLIDPSGPSPGDRTGH